MTPQRLLPFCVLLLIASVPTAADAGRELRVCADPDNLPFSNERLAGFENKIAQVVADDLHKAVRYAWAPQSGAFIRQTLNAGKCDVVIGVPTEWGQVLATRPYYASTYVFVYPNNKRLSLSSFDDPLLRKLKIGLPVIGAPASAVAERGLASNVVGFPMFPPGKIIDSVATGEIDVAVVWGPLGGYFAKHQRIPLAVTPVSVTDDDPSLRFTFKMSMGVRREDTALKEQLERVLDRRQKEILKILEEFAVPIISSTTSASMSAKSIH